MKKFIILFGAVSLSICASAATVDTGMRQARQFMKQKQPAKAGEALRQLLARNPGDSWLLYDTAVAAYAAGQFAEADQTWEEMAGTELPPRLRDKVWSQIGNVSFRLGEQAEKSAPEDALPKWEQSREAYRIVLATRPRDKMVQHNLRVVELKLAQLHARLASRLVQEARNKSVQEAIDKLQAALDHQRSATEMDPQNQQYQQQQREIERTLADKFTEKAAREEKKADPTLEKTAASDWELRQAEKDLRTALTDFQEAAALDPQNQTAEQGEKRVEQKLAEILDRQGRQRQQQARSEAKWDPDRAAETYENALEKFEEALTLQPDHADAQAGEKEVKEELEQLHIEAGDKLAEQGRKELKWQPAGGAEKMINALEHYQQAQAINPDNPTLPPKIEALEKELPPLLVALGQKEQQQAAQDEPKSPEDAIGHLEKASTSYEMAQQLERDNLQAAHGQEEVQRDLARLREMLAQRAEASNQQQQQSQQRQNQPPQQNQQQSQEQNMQNFNSLLAQVKDPEKQKQYDESRRADPTKYDPQRNRIYKNW